MENRALRLAVLRLAVVDQEIVLFHAREALSLLSREKKVRGLKVEEKKRKKDK
jgi:hypothetical protein